MGDVWVPEEGERVKVVGMPGYENAYGTAVGRTGSGLARVRMDVDGKIVGASSYQIRQLGDLEALAAEAPAQLSDVAALLREFRFRASTSGGREAAVWTEAVNLTVQHLGEG